MGDRLRAGGREARLFAATLLLPSSAYGRAAMNELHQQTVSLLSFQTVPQEVFAAQVAFNVLAAFGAEAKVSLAAEHAAISEQYARLSGGTLPELGLQVVQVPVFHGYTASLFVELAEAASVAELEAALAGEHVRVVPQDAVAPARQGGASAGEEEEDEPEAEGDAAPSNLAAAGQDEILVRVTADGTGDRGTRFWIWMAADHLRLATAAAVECALHMRRLRPQGAVQ